MKNNNNSERISKVIAKSSQYSRRQVEQLIIEGRVRIDGMIIDRPNICLIYTSDAADEKDSVDLDGRRIIK